LISGWVQQQYGLQFALVIPLFAAFYVGANLLAVPFP
jgi:hypothetical protein